MVIRYAVRMRNGDYMVQNHAEDAIQRILIRTVDNPIDADLLKTKKTAQRCIDEILSGNTNVLVQYDEENPPKEVVELEINYQVK